MTTQVLVDQVTTITVEFRDWSNAGTGDLVPMATVEVAIVEEAATPDYGATPVLAEEVIPGVYSYEWTPTAVGVYDLYFKGITSEGDITVVDETFSVVEELSSSNTTLGTDVEFTFIGNTYPLYVDPDEVLTYYSSATYTEIVELIHRYSKEADKLTGGAEPNLLVEDYVRASVLCSLSRIYGGAGSVAEGETVTLGDLSISKGSSSGSSSGLLNRGNATTWCEIAQVLRQEIVRSHHGLKGVTRGIRRGNPMPRRSIRTHDRGIRGPYSR